MKKNLLILGVFLLSIGQIGAQGLTVTLADDESTEYTGTEKKLKVVVDDTEEVLTESAYDADMTIKDADDYTIEITGKDGTAGEGLSGEFTITITSADLSGTTFGPIASVDYDGDPKQPTIENLNHSTVTFQEGDYAIKIDGGDGLPTDAGTYQVTLVPGANGNLMGSPTDPVPFTINPKVLTEANFTLNPATFTYTGLKQVLTGVTSSEIGDADFSFDDSEFDNKNVADKMKVKIILSNDNYNFMDGENSTMELIIEKGIAPYSIAGQTFQDLINEIDQDGYPFEGGNVEIENLPGSYSLGDFTLNKGLDFEYVYGNNTGVTETATVGLKGIVNFEGLSEAATFKITAAEFNVTVQTEAIFTGAEIKPVVTLAGTELKEGEDYTITITAGPHTDDQIIDVGEYVLTIEPTANFEGEALEDQPFEVKQADIAGVKFEINEKAYDDGNAITLEKTDILSAELGDPGVDVKDDGSYDFEADSYLNNIEAGIAKVVIKGEGNLKNTQQVEFKITKPLDHVDISVEIPAQYHTGAAITPTSIIVRDKTKILKDGVDYTFTLEDLEDNTNMGKASATVKLNEVVGGVYKGERTDTNVEFNIVERPETFTVSLSIAEGLEVRTFPGGGDLTVEDGESLTIEFRPINPDTKKEDILLMVNGKEADFTFGEGAYYSSYSTGPVTDDMSIEIALNDYKISIPEVEGATIYPAPGEYDIPYGEPFTFTLTLNDDYDESEVKIYVNGEEVQPEPLKSITYTIVLEKVDGPIVITIEGVKRNETSNVGLEDGVRIYSENGNLIVETDSPAPLKVYTPTGVLKAARVSSETESIPLNPGIYIVQLGDKTYKVVVK